MTQPADANPQRGDISPEQLREAMIRAYPQDKFEILCLDLGTHYDRLRGNTLDLKIAYLIEEYRNKFQYEQLIQKVIADHPYLEDELKRECLAGRESVADEPAPPHPETQSANDLDQQLSSTSEIAQESADDTNKQIPWWKSFVKSVNPFRGESKYQETIASLKILSIISVCIIAIIVSLWERVAGILPPQLVFDPAESNESLIIVANFDDRSEGQREGVDPDQYIYDQLLTRVKRDDLDIRVERLPDVLDDNNARSIGETYNATLVLWGWYDTLSVTPRLERIKGLQQVMTDEEGQAVSIADPERIEFSVVDDLPALSSYLVLVTLGVDRLAEREYDTAHTYLTSAIETILPNEVELTTKPDEAYFLRGFVNYEMESYDQAVIDYTHAITLEYEPLSWTYNNRGLAYSSMREYEQAIADFDQAIALDPDYVDAYIGRGLAVYEQGEHKEAIEDYAQAIDLDPQNAVAYYNRGLTYYRQKEYETAIEDYSRVIEFEPNVALVYYSRGAAYAAQGNYAQAIVDYTEYTHIVPNDPNGWNGLCWWGTLTGAAADVANACEQAVTLAPEHEQPFHQDSRGLNRALNSDTQGAIEDFEAFVAWAEEHAVENEEMSRLIPKRNDWIAALKEGGNPFDEATLEALRREF